MRAAFFEKIACIKNNEQVFFFVAKTLDIFFLSGNL